jgi:hypothetical protein
MQAPLALKTQLEYFIERVSTSFYGRMPGKPRTQTFEDGEAQLSVYVSIIKPAIGTAFP